MSIDPMVVAAGAALCLIPIGIGLLVAYWPRPSLKSAEEREAEKQFSDLYDQVIGDTLFYEGDEYRQDAVEAWIKGGPEMEDDRHYLHCVCPMCRDRRTEREISRRAAAARRQ